MTARACRAHARDRISAGQRCWPDTGPVKLAAGSHDARLAAVLDMFDRTGDVPREIR